jgi:hypothetical protein
MRGHLRERSPGHWAIVLESLDGAGKRKRRWFSFQGTKREAQRRCAELIADTRGGSATSPERMTVEQYLERWLDHMRPFISPKSHERYAQMVRANLIPVIGTTLIAKVTPMQISGAYATMIRGGLAPATVYPRPSPAIAGTQARRPVAHPAGESVQRRFAATGRAP